MSFKFKLNRLLPGLPDEVLMSMVPRVDQLEDLHLLLGWDKAACYSEVGTGKSLVSYLYIMAKLHQGKGVVVVMPPPLIPQYRRNFEVIEGHNFKFGVLHEDRTKRHAEMDVWDETGWPDVVFTSYHLYVKYAATFRNVNKYKVLVADEAQYLSRVTNKFFQAMFMSVWARNMDLLIMTATPSTTELITAYGQIRIRNPKAYSSLSQFERLHVVYKVTPIGDNKKIKDIIGYVDIPLIQQNLMHHAVRRRAKDVLSLQKPTLIEHLVELSDAHSDLYRKLLSEMMLEMGDELLVARNKQALRQMALQIITNVSKYTEDKLEDVPFQTLQALISKVNVAENKLIIFVNFVDTVGSLARRLAEYNPALVYGGSNTERNVQKFLEDPTCRIAIINFVSGGAGFNLQPVCHDIVFYEAIGSPGMIQQGIGRVQRGGQTHLVRVWLLQYALTISRRLYNKAYRRADELRQSVGDEVSFVDFLTDQEPASIEEELGLRLE